MSNEELVVAIQAGENRMDELWGQVREFIVKQAYRIMPALAGRVDIELDDLIQSGYLALAAAVASYKPGGAAFLTFLQYHLKTAFAETTHFRSSRNQREAKCTPVSLDAPIGGEDALTLGECVQDPDGETMLEDVEDQIWRAQLRTAVADAFHELPEDQQELLRLRFWDNVTLRELAEIRGISVENVRQRELKALRTLRKPNTASRLRPFYDFDFYMGTGLGTFRNSGMSIQDRYLIQKESRREQNQYA